MRILPGACIHQASAFISSLNLIYSLTCYYDDGNSDCVHARDYDYVHASVRGAGVDALILHWASN